MKNALSTLLSIANPDIMHIRSFYFITECLMKKVLKKCLVGLSLILMSGCAGEGQHMYYWERPNTGAVWFARDHNECLAIADMWPYEWPGMPWGWGAPKQLELRFDNDSDHGIWAQFVPFPGAQPVHVNSVAGDWSISYDDYEECMMERNYTQRRPVKVDKQVFFQ